MKKSIKKLIKEYEKIKPNCKVKYIEEHYASIEIHNSGGLISVLEPFELRQEVDFVKSKQ